MIGMTVGLVACLAIVQVFSSNEAHRRATAGAADSQQAGTLASWQMMRATRMAGAGLQHGATLWGCPLRVWRAGTAILPRGGAWPAPFGAMPADLPLTPIAVRDGGGTNPDTLLVMSAGSGVGAAPIPMSIVSPTSANVASSTGFNSRDFLLAADASAVQPCAVAQVDATYAAIPGSAAPSAVPIGAPGSAYNPPGGLGVMPAGRDYVMFNLGAAPSIAMYGVLNNQLVQLDALQLNGVAAPVVQAENVENLQIVYGVDDGVGGGIPNDNVIDRWVAPSDAAFDFAAMVTGGAATLQVKALRLAIVIRSADSMQQQGPATLTLFADLPPALQVTLNYSGAERAFMRQVHDLVIPLRNQATALCAEVRRAAGVPATGACG